MARAVSYKTVDIPVMFRDITNHPITGLARAAFKHLAFSSSCFSNTGQLTARDILYIYMVYLYELFRKFTEAESRLVFT